MFYHRFFRGFFMEISCHIPTDGGFHGYTLTPTAPPSLRQVSQLCTIDQLRMMVPRQGREAHIHMGGKCHVQATPPWRIWMLLQLLRIMIHFVEMGKIIWKELSVILSPALGLWGGSSKLAHALGFICLISICCYLPTLVQVASFPRNDKYIQKYIKLSNHLDGECTDPVVMVT